MEQWRTIEEAPRYRVSNKGRVFNKTLSREVRVFHLHRTGRAHVFLNRDGQTAKQMFIDELMEKYFGE
jgi:hypothetical protein